VRFSRNEDNPSFFLLRPCLSHLLRAPWQALETATILPAKAYVLTKDLGTLEPGHLADLIIASGDPLKNIDDAAKVECVMKNGQLQSVASVMAPFASSTIRAAMCPAPLVSERLRCRRKNLRYWNQISDIFFLRSLVHGYLQT
jgi:adenine deaminase